jgi:putative transposase
MTARKPLPVDLIDALLADYKKPEDLIGEAGLLKQLTKVLVERALNTVMTDLLGHSKHAPVANPTGNTGTARAAKPSRAISANSPSKFPVTVWASSSPGLLASIRPVGRASDLPGIRSLL